LSGNSISSVNLLVKNYLTYILLHIKNQSLILLKLSRTVLTHKILL